MFELIIGDRAEGGPGFLGLWATDRPPSAVSFAAPSTAADDAVWRVDLPADPGLAVMRLAGAEAALGRSHSALAEARDRLAAVVGAQRTGPAFEMPSEERGLPPPEVDLLFTLQEIGRGNPAVSFDQGETLTGGEPRAQRLHAFVTPLLLAVAHYAWVETQVEGQLLGRTAVTWGGDVDTVWREGIGPEQVALHQRTLGLAVASRTAWLRMFGLAAWGAVQLSAALATPGGALLALPAVWRFVNQVQAEIARTAELV